MVHPLKLIRLFLANRLKLIGLLLVNLLKLIGLLLGNRLLLRFVESIIAIERERFEIVVGYKLIMLVIEITLVVGYIANFGSRKSFRVRANAYNTTRYMFLIFKVQSTFLFRQ